MNRCFCILAYNHPKILEKLIDSLLPYKLPIILFDNGSSAPLQFPSVQSLRVSQNLGFAKGANILLTEVFKKFNDVLFLTSDTRVKDLHWPIMENPSLIAPKIIFFSGEVDSLGGGYSSEGLRHLKGDENLVQEKFYVPGTAFFMNKKFWDLGLRFDENYFMYWEDVKLSLQAQELDIELGIHETTQIEHLGRATTKSKAIYSQYYFWRNWYLTNQYSNMPQDGFWKKFHDKYSQNQNSFYLNKLQDEIKTDKYKTCDY